MKTSDNGVEFIKKHEGVVDKVYLDPIGLPTVGVGHLLSEEEKKKWPIGTVLSDDEIDKLLREDLREAEDCLAVHVTVDVTQEMFDALVSFVFNVGEGAFQHSTLLKYINKSEWELAADEFDRWVFAGGKKLNGLAKRREAEKDLFMSNLSKEVA